MIPTEIATLLPEAFSTFTLPVVMPDGSRSRVEGVPNIDWTYLFSHAVAVTQVKPTCCLERMLVLMIKLLQEEATM